MFGAVITAIRFFPGEENGGTFSAFPAKEKLNCHVYSKTLIMRPYYYITILKHGFDNSV